MNAIKKTRKLIEADHTTPAAQTLASLVRALESDETFALASLYRLDYETFNLAIDVLKEWRLDRYYMSKIKLYDFSLQLASA
jgi:hypothetical protein